MNKRPFSIETEIDKIKKALLKLEHIHPGSLSQQKRSRGGVYHQLSYSHAGKAPRYVLPKDVPQVL